MARPFDLVPLKMSRQGPPPQEAKREVLLIHGAWRGSWVWQDMAEAAAAAGFGVNLLDLPGHSLPPWQLPWSTSLRDYAMYVARAVGRLSRPILAGHSMGGWIVQKILELIDLPAVLLAPLPGSGLPFKGLLNFVVDHPQEVLGGF